MSAHNGRQHPLPAMVRPAPGVVDGGDQPAAVRRQAGELEHACGSLAEQVARLAATVTELVERPAPVRCRSRWRRRPGCSGSAGPTCSS